MSRKERRRAQKIGAPKAGGSFSDRAQHLFASAVRQHRSGQLIEAERLYQSVLAIEPEHADSLYLRGIIALQLRRPREAIEAIRGALAINEPMPEWHYNLAFAYQSLGQLENAVAHYRRAVAIDPGFMMAQTNLARALLTLGASEEALAVAMRALEKQAAPETKQLVAECLSNLRQVTVTQELRDVVLRAASEPWGIVANFTHVVIALLNPAIAPMIRRAVEAWPQRLQADALLGTQGISVLAEDRLFRCLLESATICSFELERFFTCLRSIILAWAYHRTPLDAAMDHAVEIGCLLAQQCFINEYVYAYADDEIEQVQQLQGRLAPALEAGTSVPALWLAAIGAYVPLHELPRPELLLERTWPDAARRVLELQIREPLQEKAAQVSIPQLTPIDHGISAQVQRQYEENPYPRWVKAVAPIGPIDIDAYLRAQFPLAPVRELRKQHGLDVLVAGCGTGQHPIHIAQQFAGARVLALDLSRTSLAYARRKTSEMGLKQIEYAQADILNLGGLSLSFDLIEAVGVLHHLADPQAGWRVLLSLLRPGGVMNIGLYSELARQDVVRARAVIAERGYGQTADDIRRCRQDLFALDSVDPLKPITSRFDFFSMSNCRDLMFHVQEHRLSLPAIKAFLAENDLQFLGFLMGSHHQRRYAARFPDDPAMIDLDRWHVFETENPSTFLTMYRFWVQKRALRPD
jgi:SAM-dependent methyltransferase/tetratricopeptide (TPR) repeat protein